MTDYKIVEFNSQTAQIVVLFVPLSMLISIDLPLDADGNAPVGNELESYIKGFLPYYALERQAKLANGVTNAAEIAALIGS